MNSINSPGKYLPFMYFNIYEKKKMIENCLLVNFTSLII